MMKHNLYNFQLFFDSVTKERRKQKTPMGNLELDAAYFAFFAHNGQKRKFSYEDYILHPAEVASIVSQVTEDQEILAAAWLHDVVEDCNVSLPSIFDDFGTNIARYVNELTNPSQVSKTLTNASRAERKEIDKAHLMVASAEAQTVKLADIMSNLPSLVYNDPKFAKVWVKEKHDLVLVMDRGDKKLRKATLTQIEMANDLLGIG